VPITIAEQIESTQEAFEAGATIAHCHVRNDDETPTSDPERFALLLEGLRAHCLGMIVQLSTGGRSGAGRERGGKAKGKGTESWVDGAREIFAATAVAALERGTPTIAAVYDLLTQPGAAGDLLAGLAAETASGEAQSVFNRFAGQPEKVLGSYMSVLFDGGLRLWAGPDVRDATAATDFWITDFRSDPASVFLCVSQKDLGVLSPLIRLMFQQMFTLLQETDRTEEDRFDVLFLLDEFASLGKMQEMGRAITTVRSSGAHLMLIVQSLANLREVYGADGAANFLGNCELQLFMAPTDTDTPRYISEAIGDQTRAVRVKSWRQGRWDAASIQERQEGGRLIRPEQIRMLGPDAAIALVRDRNPVVVAKVRYYEDRGLMALFEEHKGFWSLPELDRIPEAGPPVGHDGRETISRTEIVDRVDPQAAAESNVDMKTSAADPPLVRLGIVRGKQVDLRQAIAAHRDGSEASGGTR